MKQSLTSQQGFTLLEVLIALVLMALLSSISWRVLDLTERSSERLNASTNDTLALVRVLGQIESDISRYANNDILPSPRRTSPSTATAAILPSGILWAEPVLTVRRYAHDGAWQQVVWGKVGDTLRRAAGPAAHTLPLPEAGAGETVLDQVQSFAVRAWIPGLGWSAPTATGAQLMATGLEIVIERRHNGVSEAYRKVVLLP